MKEIFGAGNRYLEVDLTSRTWTVYQATYEDLKNYLGGKGLGLKIFYDRLKDRLPQVDPLGP